MTICIHEDCETYATFGDPITMKATHCKKHSLSGHIDVKHKTCSEPTCTKQPSYGERGTNKREFCAEHSPSHYVNVVTKTCSEPNCNLIPVFGERGTRIAIFCKKHALKEHVNVKDKTCFEPNCTTKPTYGKRGTNNAIFCKNHCPPDYIDVKHKTCSESNCILRACYGQVGTKQPIFCKLHCPIDFIDVLNQTCSEPNCTTRPVYGKQGTNNAIFCNKHRSIDCVNVRQKTCSETQCTKQPTYGDKNDMKPIFCKAHALKDHIDVLNKKCSEPDCTTQPRFGIPSYSPEFCTKHKKSNMIKNPTQYKDGYILCKICITKVHYTENYCPGCKTYLIDNKTVKGKIKELAIKNLLEENKIEFTHDSKVKGGCSKRRPDFIIHTNWGTIILEVDEFQHNRKAYPCECEIERMKEIYDDVGVQNLLFIRYNPDTYKVVDGQKKYTTIQRQQYLVKYIEEQIHHDNLAVVYLFYDGFINPPEKEHIQPN